MNLVMKTILVALNVLFASIASGSVYECRHVGRHLESFEFYYGSETQKEYARDQAEAYAEKHHGVVIERTASFEVYECND